MMLPTPLRSSGAACRGPVSRIAVPLVVALASLVVADGARAEIPGAQRALAGGDCKAAGDAINAGLQRNDDEAFFLAGYMYDQGQCVEADPVRAMRLYRRAAALGSASASVFLGLMYGLGHGVPQDYALAHLAFNGDKPAAADASATPAELIAMGYAETLAQLAFPKVAYPTTANSQGVEATIDVVVDAASDHVEFERMRVGTEIGSRMPRTHDFTDPIEAAYRDAMKQAPRPALPAGAPIRVVTQWQFAMRRGPENQKVRLEGTIMIADTHPAR